MTHHNLVPKHRCVVDYDAHPVSDLPVLLTSDKICQYYDFALNSVIEITRTAGVQEPMKYYRVVKSASQ